MAVPAIARKILKVRRPLPLPKHQGPQEPRVKIEPVTAGIAIAIAFLIDLLEAVLLFAAIGLLVNPLISIFALIGFFLWFNSIGIRFFEGPLMGWKLAGGFGGIIAELTPAFGGLFFLSAAVVAILLAAWVEEKRKKTPV